MRRLSSIIVVYWITIFLCSNTIFQFGTVVPVSAAEVIPSSSGAKLRNVDDPDADPEQVSQIWLNILGRYEGFTKGTFNSYTERLNQTLGTIGGGGGGESKISLQCELALRQYFGHPFDRSWTLKMWDSNGHFPSGILSASFFEPGNYDQCLSIAGDIPGKYCIMDIKVPKPIRLVNFTGTRYQAAEDAVNFVTSWDQFSAISNGICVPAVCTDEEIGAIVPKVMAPVDPFGVETRVCQTKEMQQKPYRFGQQVALVIIVVNLVLALLGTLLDQLPFTSRSSNYLVQLLRAFSIVENSRILCRINKSPAKQTSTAGTGPSDSSSPQNPMRGQFKFMHGIRVLSIYWVVFAHVFLMHPFLELHNRVSPVQSMSNIRKVIENPATHFVVNAGLSVMTFFVISGALSIYSILPIYKNRPINFFTYAMLRWFRFASPSLGMICMVILWPTFGSGPLFHEEFTGLVTDACYTHWWANFLMITNHLPSTQMCNIMSWYLSADFQLHILLYVVIYFFYRYRRLTFGYIFAMIVVGFISPVLIVMAGIADAPNPSIFLHPQNKFPIDNVGVFIFGTYNHLIPYFFGVLLGLIYIRKKPVQISPITKWILWLVLCPLAMLLPFSSYSFVGTSEPVHSPLESAITFGIVRLIWSAAMAFLCWRCASGGAGLVRHFFSADIFQPLSRLSFSIYLAHIIPIWHYFFSIRNPIDVSFQNMIFIGTANSVLATLLAFFLYLLFEAPYVNLFKLIVGPLINHRRPSPSSGHHLADSNNNRSHNNNENNAFSTNKQTSAV